MREAKLLDGRVDSVHNPVAGEQVELGDGSLAGATGQLARQFGADNDMSSSTFSRAAGSANNPSNVFLGIFSKAALVGAKTVNTASWEAAVAAKLVRPRAVNSVENSGVLPIRLATEVLSADDPLELLELWWLP